MTAGPKRRWPELLEQRKAQSLDGVAPEWAKWAHRWREKTTMQSTAKQDNYELLLRVGRWLAHTHPDIVSPGHWTRELAVEYVATVDRWCIGDWASDVKRIRNVGKPLKAATKARYIKTVRTFFLDCEAWGWIRRRFDPTRYLTAPRSLRAQLAAQPGKRVIDPDVWARLVWAGLNLTEFDVETEKPWSSHPFHMVKAIAVTWLFCGLRSNEIRRLRVGCTRRHVAGASCRENVCYLDVPASKSQPAFTKSVDQVVGEVIQAWEAVRPRWPSAVDEYTREVVDFLFTFRGRPLGRRYLNGTLIPLLCRKAGIPEIDSKGPITAHRARATIASMLANGDEPMSLLALKEWLGHATANATLHYVQDDPITLTKAYTDAGYFGRNIRVIQVLINREAIKSGATIEGEPWKFYDLGHGFCTYDFFDQCPHRMACARCSFYRPKEGTLEQLEEARGNLQRLLQKIPLTEAEAAAVQDGREAVERLCELLAGEPAPDGKTRQQLSD